jgi:hypothetical protein
VEEVVVGVEERVERQVHAPPQLPGAVVGVLGSAGRAATQEKKGGCGSSGIVKINPKYTLPNISEWRIKALIP